MARYQQNYKRPIDASFFIIFRYFSSFNKNNKKHDEGFQERRTKLGPKGKMNHYVEIFESNVL